MVGVVAVIAVTAVIAPLLVACSSDDDAGDGGPSSDGALSAEEAAERAVELADAPVQERLQGVVDALPELSEETYEQVGVLADLPEGVLADDVVVENVASFGDDATGWFVVERRAGTVEENEVALVERLTAAGYAETEEIDLDNMPQMRVFERESDNTAVGVNISDVSEDAADGADFPTRIGYLTTPEVSS